MVLRNADGSPRNLRPIHARILHVRKLLARLNQRFDYGHDSLYAAHIELGDELVAVDEIDSVWAAEDDRHARVTLKSGRVVLIAASTLVVAVLGAKLLIRRKKP